MPAFVLLCNMQCRFRTEVSDAFPHIAGKQRPAFLVYFPFCCVILTQQLVQFFSTQQPAKVFDTSWDLLSGLLNFDRSLRLLILISMG